MSSSQTGHGLVSARLAMYNKTKSAFFSKGARIAGHIRFLIIGHSVGMGDNEDTLLLNSNSGECSLALFLPLIQKLAANGHFGVGTYFAEPLTAMGLRLGTLWVRMYLFPGDPGKLWMIIWVDGRNGSGWS